MTLAQALAKRIGSTVVFESTTSGVQIPQRLTIEDSYSSEEFLARCNAERDVDGLMSLKGMASF